MAATVKVELDFAGIGEFLRSDKVGAAVADLAYQVADGVEAQGLTAEAGGGESGPDIRGVVDLQVTDRARATVTIQHPAGAAMQAKHGVLTKAAAAAGLEVRS